MGAVSIHPHQTLVDEGLELRFETEAGVERTGPAGRGDRATLGATIVKIVVVTIAILAGNQNAPNLQRRVQGAKDASAAAQAFSARECDGAVSAGSVGDKKKHF